MKVFVCFLVNLTTKKRNMFQIINKNIEYETDKKLIIKTKRSISDIVLE